MEYITFRADPNSFGKPGYHVPVVVPMAPKTHSSPLENRVKKSFHEINQEFGEVILRYNEGDSDYKREHKHEYMKARKKLVYENRGFIISKARKYRYTGLDKKELKYLAIMAARRASKSFDFRESSFANYVNYWIKKFILEALTEQKNSAVKIPNGIVEAKNVIEQAEFCLRGAREIPTEEATVDYLQIYRYTEKSKAQIKRLVKGKRILEEEVYSIDDSNVPKSRERSPYEKSELDSELSKMRRLLQILNEKQMKVIVHVLGLDGNEPTENMDEIARRLSWSDQRVRYQYKTALGKLRSFMCPEKDEVKKAA
jgi:RNA polymerase sigma factor (sigma-70 family)